MNIGSSSATASVASLYRTRKLSTQADDETLRLPPPDRDDGRTPGGPGGPMVDALAQAFQSMGLSMPPPPAPSSSTGDSTSGGDADTSSSSSASSTSAVGQDLQGFLHGLFDAIRSDASSTDASGSAAATNAGSSATAGSFSAGLSSLISQVASGSAPSGLQDAFSKLVTDLQSVGGGSTGTRATTGDTGGTASSSDDTTLQAFLTHLQQNIGYGAQGRSRAVGSLLDSMA